MVALHHLRNRTALAIALALGSLIGSPVITGAEPLGLYAGGAIGQARIDTGNLEGASPSGGVFSFGTYTENHSAYKLIAGFRPLSLIGAEIAYMDFGHPDRSFSPPGSTTASADVKMSGAAAFGMLYLPVPVVSVYAKAGLARLQATSNVALFLPGVGTCTINNPNCAWFSRRNSVTNTGLAAGAGAQLKLGAWALRAEYERFNVAGGNPGLASLAATWTF
jgi:opacity protein-like surface antigen